MSKVLPDYAGLFCLTVFIISLGTISGGLIRDGDTFWHIKAGAVMLEQRGLLTSDIFSHTANGVPWTAHEWLAEIIMAWIHGIAGLEGLLCFFLLLASLTFWLLFKITEKNANPLVTFGFVLVALFYSPSHLSPRPHMFTWLLMLVTLHCLTTGGKKLYSLPLITAIWANLHGGFVIGLVLQAIFIFGFVLEDCWVNNNPLPKPFREQRLPIFIFLLSLLASGINPFGYELLLFPFQVSNGLFSVLIDEWKAPDLQTLWYFRCLIITMVLLVSFPKSTLNWTERLLLIFFLNASLTHVRHIILMVLALTPGFARIVNTHLEIWLTKKQLNKQKTHLKLSSVSGPILTIAIALTLLTSSSFGHSSLSFLTPYEYSFSDVESLNHLVAFLDKEEPRGNIFNHYILGGYLIYALSPKIKVFIDGRADMYGEKILKDYDTIATASPGWEKMLDLYKIEWVVYDTNSELITRLMQSGGWQMEYTGKHFAVISKNAF